jgi:hypothetical protein
MCFDCGAASGAVSQAGRCMEGVSGVLLALLTHHPATCADDSRVARWRAYRCVGACTARGACWLGGRSAGPPPAQRAERCAGARPVPARSCKQPPGRALREKSLATISRDRGRGCRAGRGGRGPRGGTTDGRAEPGREAPGGGHTRVRRRPHLQSESLQARPPRARSPSPTRGLPPRAQSLQPAQAPVAGPPGGCRTRVGACLPLPACRPATWRATSLTATRPGPTPWQRDRPLHRHAPPPPPVARVRDTWSRYLVKLPGHVTVYPVTTR